MTFSSPSPPFHPSSIHLSHLIVSQCGAVIGGSGGEEKRRKQEKERSGEEKSGGEERVCRGLTHSLKSHASLSNASLSNLSLPPLPLLTLFSSSGTHQSLSLPPLSTQSLCSPSIHHSVSLAPCVVGRRRGSLTLRTSRSRHEERKKN